MDKKRIRNVIYYLLDNDLNMECFWSYEELKKIWEVEWIDYLIELTLRDEDTIIVSPHWWSIEKWTTEISRKIAEIWWFSHYSFSGIKKSGNFKLHITSSSFDEPECLKAINSHQIVVTIHWCRSIDDIIYVWWKNETLRTLIIQTINLAWFNAPDFSITTPYKWLCDNNVCNKWKSNEWWVQIEISRSLRDKMMRKELLISNFAMCIVKVLQWKKINTL